MIKIKGHNFLSGIYIFHKDLTFEKSKSLPRLTKLMWPYDIKIIQNFWLITSDHNNSNSGIKTLTKV